MKAKNLNEDEKKVSLKFVKKKSKKKKQAFTLIELLAVIVILGLLIAIAIPSITRYITQSRRKTVVSSIDGYISSVINDVNDQKYNFTKLNTIYAIPIECISLEKGGDNPFGEWSPVSDNYWAYVLVQYDAKSYSYTYGFTFKDSSGYGMYPTVQSEINSKSSTQIKTGLELNKPKSGFYTKITVKENWLGFEINDNTKVSVLDNNTCAMTIPCTGEGTDVGDIITCGSESFHVIENNGSTITAFAKYAIELENFTQKNGYIKPVIFSKTIYWQKDGVLKKEYVGRNIPFVFDSNSDIYTHVVSYENKLINDFGVLSVKTSLISTEQLEKLGCVRTGETGATCKNALSFVITQQHYWTGSATGKAYLWYVNSDGEYHGRQFNYDANVRPIVTISKDEINFN